MQRAHGHIDLCSFWTWNHDSFPVLVFGAQGGIKGAHFGYVKYWREHAQGFIENGGNVGEPDNIRVGLQDTRNLIRMVGDLSRLDVLEAAPSVPSRGSLRVPFAVPPGTLRVLQWQTQERD